MISKGCFEKIPEAQFLSDGGKGYESIKLPLRATRHSAGYDFFLPFTLTLQPGDKYTVPTGIRCRLNHDKFLAILPKSGLGTKYGLALANTIGIIDSDYYNADNYGHIMVTLINRGTQPISLEPNQPFVQGIVMTYFTLDEDEVLTERKGGHGSTYL